MFPVLNSATALLDIINQCMNDTSFSYTGSQGMQQGNWNYGTESYWIEIAGIQNYTAPFDGLDDYDQAGILSQGDGDDDQYVLEFNRDITKLVRMLLTLCNQIYLWTTKLLHRIAVR
jgi:hypothetical protein